MAIYNYRHLLLMRQEVSGEVKYYIGVPGNFMKEKTGSQNVWL